MTVTVFTNTHTRARAAWWFQLWTLYFI